MKQLFFFEFYRPDLTLKSLVYKLVPGMYQAEHQRLINFYDNEKQENHFDDKNKLMMSSVTDLVKIINKDETENEEIGWNQQEYFSPEESIR